ncbi:UTP-glucose-1-phosphate uridylyltransferase [Arthroderma uncinatum]|uniref:UTP-glucose-1-phosphate uridylyltransferase n=1 Tax=Arthroderma uncinatum TaxID=74035 RepID=UPI00144A96CE|nr:UTP-glucose-1-phosphate uridylyltransferase [Arthroderma uncinatum]KAF3483929.1 UTP-glucose-1-phosphate uridylyltransferase [Arthroderma uncinatum]
MASGKAFPTHLRAPGAEGRDEPHSRHHIKSQSNMAFESASTNVAAAQMRNALNALSDTVKDPAEKKRCEAEMDNFFSLFRRYLNDKAKGNVLSWDRIAPPQPNQVVEYDDLGNSASSDLYTLKHGQLVIDPNRFGDAPLIKLGTDFKKVSDFMNHIPSIPRILELDHLTISGAVNLGRGVTLKGTVIIVATEGSTIDIPPGSILENVVVQGSLRILEH